MARNSIIYQFDYLTQRYEELLHCNGFEEKLKIILSRLKNQDQLETRCLEKSNECERLKCSLDNTREKVKKLGSLYDAIEKDYVSLLKNYPSWEWLNFVTHPPSSAVQIKNPTNAECNCAKSSRNELQSEELSKRYEKLQNKFTEELRNREKTKEQCRRLQTELQAVRTKLQTADEELTNTDELLSTEEMFRLKFEIERDSLICLAKRLELILLKYEQHSSPADNIVACSTLTNEKPTTELDTMIEYESDVDLVLELSLSPSLNIVNDEIADEIIEAEAIQSPSIENGGLSILEEPLLSDDTSARGTLLSSPKINASEEQPKPHFECDFCGKIFLKKRLVRKHLRKHMISRLSNQSGGYVQLTTAEKMEQSLSVGSVASNQRAYNTRRSKEKGKLIKSNMPKKPKVRSAAIINASPVYENDSNLRCDICGKCYSWKQSLYHHKRIVHLGVKPHKCRECNKTFARKAELKEHESVHSSRRPFQCSVCNQSFKTVCNRRRHVRIVHENVGFCCAHCNRKFNAKSNLIYHITVRHLPELGKPFKCTTCDKLFIQKSHLNNHQAVHISKSTHKCSMCEKSFKDRRNKLRHERLTHMEGFRFTCAHCDRGFRSKGGILSHIQRLHL